MAAQSPPGAAAVPVEKLTKGLSEAFALYEQDGYNSKVESAYSKSYKDLQTHAAMMTPEEDSARADYKGSGYDSMNASARTGKHSHDKRVARLTEWLNRCRIPADMTLVRRVGGAFAASIMSVATVGTRIKECGFVSASVDPERMRGWAGGDGTLSSNNVRLIMMVPAEQQQRAAHHDGARGDSWCVHKE
jgi:hypothetical protein